MKGKKDEDNRCAPHNLANKEEVVMEPFHIRFQKLENSRDGLIKERNELLKKLATAKRIANDLDENLISVLKILNPSYYDDTFTRGDLDTHQLMDRIKEESKSLRGRYMSITKERR